MSWSGPNASNTACRCALRQPAEVELVVVAQEEAPLRRRRARLRRLQRRCERPHVGRGQRVEEVLVHLEVEHHVHAVAVVAEVLHVGFRQDVGFGEDDRVAVPPLQELAQRAQHVVLLAGLRRSGPWSR